MLVPTSSPVLTPFAAALLLASSIAAYAQNRQGGSARPFGDAGGCASEFDDPARDEWQKPDVVIRALGLSRNSVVAEIGSATGYFSVRLARAVPAGRVISVDVEASMVRYLAQRAKRERLTNISVQLDLHVPPRLTRSTDLVLLVDTYPYIRRRERYFSKLRAVLKPGARLVIIDFRVDSPLGPPLHERIPSHVAKVELAHAGFEFLRQHFFLPHQHFLVLRAGRRSVTLRAAS